MSQQKTKLFKPEDFDKDISNVNKSPQTVSNDSNNPNKSKYIVAAIIGLLALGGVGYYLSQQGGEKGIPTEIPNKSEKVNDDNNSDNTQNGKGQVVEETSPADDKTTSSDDKAVPDGSDKKSEDVSTDQSNIGNEYSSENGAQTKPKESSVNTPSSQKPSETSQPDVTYKTNQSSTSPNVTNNNITPSTPVGSITEEAKNVIRGKYGTNPDRRRLLGSRYSEIQGKVNEMYRKRKFY